MNLLYEKESNENIETTKEKVISELKNIGFGVLWELNFKEKFKEKGFDYPYNFWVMEVCNPGKAIKVLTENQKAGYFLPCKVVVYESESGIMAGLMKPSDMVNQLFESDVLTGLAEEVEEQLKEAVDKATA